MNDEIDQIVARYERRKTETPGRYSPFNPEVLFGIQERQRELIRVFRQNYISKLDDLRILEIGCGSGANLIELISLGAKPDQLTGNELLNDRLERARNLLPSGVQLHPGDAAMLPFAPSTFDIVYQSTVFSSILDDSLQERISKCMWSWVRPGGGVLWYDFIYNNPRNPDVRGVPIDRIKDLFPDGNISFKRVTLAPPISRRICKIHPNLYQIFNTIPLLRTHVLCWIGKNKE